MNLWIWYIAGTVLTLLWKWQYYCAYGQGMGKPFWLASKEWFKLETLGSKVSWGATIGGIWLLGWILINRQGGEWLFGAAVNALPNCPPMVFFVGAIQEVIIPAMTKRIVGKFGGDGGQ